MAIVVPVRTGATEGRPELYPETLSRACRGIVEGLSNGHRAGRAPRCFVFLMKDLSPSALSASAHFAFGMEEKHGTNNQDYRDGRRGSSVFCADLIRLQV